MDLYASTSKDKFRNLIYHENFIVKDEIPENGYIDESSIDIRAVVPVVTRAEGDKTFNNGYKVKNGVYYAQRYGTQRYVINEFEGEPKGPQKITKITQNEGETYDEFLGRIKKQKHFYVTLEI